MKALFCDFFNLNLIKKMDCKILQPIFIRNEFFLKFK